MSIPEDAMRAANASRSGALNAMDEVAAALEFTTSQLQPALAQLSAELGVEVDAVGFALGMLGGTFALQGVDLIKCVRMAPTQFAEFVTRAGAMQGREVCGHRGTIFPSVVCGLDPGHGGFHAAGRLRWGSRDG